MTDGTPPAPSLLEQMQGLIERTYDLSTGIDDVGAYVIGDTGLRELYGGRPQHAHAPEQIASGTPAAARTLVRQEGEELRLTVYFPDALIEHLEAHPPLRALDERNVDQFAVFVEELDHLLHIAHRRRSGLDLTLLELEWQANITKTLVTRHLLARRSAPRPLGEAEEHWIRFHLFEKLEYTGEDPAVVERYREASRLAVRTLDSLEPLEPPARLEALRLFARRSFPEKLRALAA